MDSGIALREVDESEGETRLTLRLSPSAKRELEAVSRQLGTSMTDVVKRSIGLQKLVLDVTRRKGRVLIEEPDQPLREIVIL